MDKITVYSKGKIRTLKAGITLDKYKEYDSQAIKVNKPSMATLESWSSECGCKAIDGCWVEPDGTCEHGYPSWLLALNYI